MYVYTCNANFDQMLLSVPDGRGPVGRGPAGRGPDGRAAPPCPGADFTPPAAAVFFTPVDAPLVLTDESFAGATFEPPPTATGTVDLAGEVMTLGGSAMVGRTDPAKLGGFDSHDLGC